MTPDQRTRWWEQHPDPVPAGCRLLEEAERTQYGDLGWMVWDRGERHEWTILRAGHVLNVMIVHKGRAARAVTAPPGDRQTTKQQTKG
jgi:hypothetical protein